MTGDCHAGILWEPGGEIPPGDPTRLYVSGANGGCRAAVAGPAHLGYNHHADSAAFAVDIRKYLQAHHGRPQLA